MTRVARAKRARGLLVAAAFGATLAAGCGPRHVQPFTPRQRVYKPGEYAQKSAAARPQLGSLFSEATGGYLEDTRAVRVGDFVLIQVDERADAKGAATTSLSQKSDGQMGASAMLGIVPALKRAYPNMDPEKLMAYASQSAFAGAGDTARNGELRGSIAVRIVKEMPNGDLFLEGTKVVLINNEEYHLYVSGLARRADIGQDNALASSRLADAQIEFTGRGDVADQQRKGWLTRLVDTLNPF
jgi:flagellar L-ring protein precursor FlgH